MLRFGAQESGFNVSLLLSKSKSFTWICLVQSCQVLFVTLATNLFCSSAKLHAGLGNTTSHIAWPGEHTGLQMKTRYKAVIHRKEDKPTGRLLGYYLKEEKVGLGSFPSRGSNAVVRGGYWKQNKESCINPPCSFPHLEANPTYNHQLGFSAPSVSHSEHHHSSQKGCSNREPTCTSAWVTCLKKGQSSKDNLVPQVPALAGRMRTSAACSPETLCSRLNRHE